MSDIERFMPVVVRLDITEGPSKSFATRMNPHSTGPWVRYKDYADLERQLADARELEKTRWKIQDEKNQQIGELHDTIADLKRQLVEKEETIRVLMEFRKARRDSPAVTDDVTDNMFLAGADTLLEHLDEVEDVGRDAITAIYKAMRRAAMEAE